MFYLLSLPCISARDVKHVRPLEPQPGSTQAILQLIYKLMVIPHLRKAAMTICSQCMWKSRVYQEAPQHCDYRILNRFILPMFYLLNFRRINKINKGSYYHIILNMRVAAFKMNSITQRCDIEQQSHLLAAWLKVNKYEKKLCCFPSFISSFIFIHFCSL